MAIELSKSDVQKLTPIMPTKQDLLPFELKKNLFKQGPLDTKTFLESPQGKAFKAAIEALHIEEIELEEELLHKACEKEKRKHKHLLHLILFVLHHKAHAKSKHLFEEQEAISHHIQNEEKHKLIEMHNAYLHLINDLEHSHETVSTQIAVLSDSITMHEHLLTYVQDVTETTHKNLQAIEHTPLDQLETTLSNRLKCLTDETCELDNVLKGLGQQKGDVVVKGTRFHRLTLNDELEMLTHLKDQLALNHAYTADGLPATNLKNAAYLVPKQHKIVHHNAKAYLIEADQDLLSFNNEQLHEAHCAYKDLKGSERLFETLTTKLTQKIDFHKNKTTAKLQAKADEIKQEMCDLQCAKDKVQHELITARTQALKAIESEVLNALDEYQKILKPVPTPKPAVKESLMNQGLLPKALQTLVETKAKANALSREQMVDGAKTPRFQNTNEPRRFLQNIYSFFNQSLGDALKPVPEKSLLAPVSFFKLESTASRLTPPLVPKIAQDAVFNPTPFKTIPALAQR